jgi:hypothetical protein
MVIVLVAIGGYSINGYWWLFDCKPFVVILLVAVDGYFTNKYLLMVISGYYIISYCWLLYVILRLLVIIVL